VGDSADSTSDASLPFTEIQTLPRRQAIEKRKTSATGNQRIARHEPTKQKGIARFGRCPFK
jgi:hypothetical protein